MRHSKSVAVPALLVLLALLPGTVAQAHNPPPPPDCVAPSRPADDQNDVSWQRFLADVDAFRVCISDYASANHAAAEAHHRAANDATLVWNRFVHSELNVPEDFPWPPPESPAPSP